MKVHHVICNIVGIPCITYKTNMLMLQYSLIPQSLSYLLGSVKNYNNSLYNTLMPSMSSGDI